MVRPTINSIECSYSHFSDEKTNTWKGPLTTSGITRKRQRYNSSAHLGCALCGSMPCGSKLLPLQL